MVWLVSSMHASPAWGPPSMPGLRHALMQALTLVPCPFMDFHCAPPIGTTTKRTEKEMWATARHRHRHRVGKPKPEASASEAVARGFRWLLDFGFDDRLFGVRGGEPRAGAVLPRVRDGARL